MDRWDELFKEQQQLLEIMAPENRNKYVDFPDIKSDPMYRKIRALLFDRDNGKCIDKIQIQLKGSSELDLVVWRDNNKLYWKIEKRNNA